MAKGPIGYGSPSATWCLGLGKKPDWL